MEEKLFFGGGVKKEFVKKRVSLVKKEFVHIESVYTLLFPILTWYRTENIKLWHNYCMNANL